MQLTLPGRCFWPCFLFASIPFIPFIPIDSLRKFLLFYPSRDDPEIFCKDESRWKTPLKAPHSLRDFIFVVDTIVVFFFFTYADYPISFFPRNYIHSHGIVHRVTWKQRKVVSQVASKNPGFTVVVCFFVFLSSAEDIKLENFMYARKDTDHLKLIDFGLSVMAFCWKKTPWFKTRLFGRRFKTAVGPFLLLRQSLGAQYQNGSFLWHLGLHCP